MKSLTRFFVGLAAVSLLAGLSVPSFAADSKPTIKALTDPGFVPFEMMNTKTGKMEGFDMDILHAIADEAGFNYDLKTMEFKGIIPSLQTKSADLALAGITITKARSKVVDFSVPYYQSGLLMMVPASNNSIKTIDDLKGKKVGTKIGSTSYKYLNDHFGDEIDIKPFPSTADMYMSLMGGVTDAVLYDAPNAAYFARVKGQGRVKVVGPLYEAQPYGVALAKGSKWLEPVNKAIKAIKANGTYNEIYKKWFGKLPDEQ